MNLLDLFRDVQTQRWVIPWIYQICYRVSFGGGSSHESTGLASGRPNTAVCHPMDLLDLLWNIQTQHGFTRDALGHQDSAVGHSMGLPTCFPVEYIWRPTRLCVFNGNANASGPLIAPLTLITLGNISSRQPVEIFVLEGIRKILPTCHLLNYSLIEW